MQSLKPMTFLAKTNRFLPLLLVFILSDEMCNNLILNSFSDKNDVFELILYICFFLVQIIAAPIQAGFSDFYCRKKSLIVSLTVSLVCMILLSLSFNPPLFILWIILLLKGSLGNTLPLAWAGIADTQISNYRYSLGLSTLFIGLGYLVVVLFKAFLDDHSSIGSSVLIALLLIVCIFTFKDLRDKDRQSDPDKTIRHDLELFANNFLKKRRIQTALFTFLLWELSFYMPHLIDVDIGLLPFKNLTLVMVVGYFFGVVSLKFLHAVSDPMMIRLGYGISTVSLVPLVVASFFLESISAIMLSCYFVYSIGVAYLVSSLFSIVSSEREPHEQGKVFGLIDSVDSFALLFTVIALGLYNFLQLRPLWVFVLSLVAILFSWISYASFEKQGRTNID